MNQTAKKFIFDTFEMLLAIGEELEVRRMIIRYLDEKRFSDADLLEAIALINQYAPKAENEEVNE